VKFRKQDSLYVIVLPDFPVSTVPNQFVILTHVRTTGFVLSLQTVPPNVPVSRDLVEMIVQTKGVCMTPVTTEGLARSILTAT
jgi:hypothetical protein